MRLGAEKHWAVPNTDVATLGSAEMSGLRPCKDQIAKRSSNQAHQSTPGPVEVEDHVDDHANKRKHVANIAPRDLRVGRNLVIGYCCDLPPGTMRAPSLIDRRAFAHRIVPEL